MLENTLKIAQETLLNDLIRDVTVYQDGTVLDAVIHTMSVEDIKHSVDEATHNVYFNKMSHEDMLENIESLYEIIYNQVVADMNITQDNTVLFNIIKNLNVSLLRDFLSEDDSNRLFTPEIMENK